MKAIFLVLLCWAALSPVAAAAPRPYHATHERRISFADQPPKIRASMRRARAVLFRVVLPDISLQAVSLSDAVEAIGQGFRERHPEHLGLSVFLRLPSSAPGPSGEPAPPSKLAPSVSLTLHSASTAEALDALCAQSDYVWYVALYGLAIVPAKDSPPIRRRPSHQRHAA